MANTSVSNVRDELRAANGIADNVSLLTDGQITTIGIDPANVTVENDVKPETSYGSSRYELIERYLAVDNILKSGIDEVRQLTSESPGDGSSYSYAGIDYQQKAKQQDPDGALENRDKPGMGIGTFDTRGNIRNGQSRRTSN